MSPNFEPVSAAGQRYTLRHVGPRAAVFPNALEANVSLLKRADMVARKLPQAGVSGTPDFVSGSWTTRLGDAGEASLLFPNTISGDGVPWRSRFDPTGHLQFIEISDNGELDFVGVIDQLPRTTDQQVEVHLSDPWWLLKKAYERDWIVVQSPRDVIERATQVWVPVAADNFPALATPALSSQWSTSTNLGGTVGIGQSGGLKLAIPGTNGALAAINGPVVTVGTSAWAATCTLQVASLPTSTLLQLSMADNVDTYALRFFNGQAQLWANGSVYAQVQVPSAPSHNLRLESDGQWIWGFLDGQLVGVIRRLHMPATQVSVGISLSNIAPASAASATVTGVLAEVLQPFLQPGTDKGDYVLPGGSSTYPSGGLHARYFNDLDLQSDTNRLVKILAPPRTQAYAGSGVSEYVNQQDATINVQANPTPGAATSNWSTSWFGAIYLKLSAGDYQFKIVCPAVANNFAVRAWLGKTQFGTQLVDAWAFTNTSSQSFTFTISAASLAGALAYGAGSVQRDGWYPIKIEWAVDATASVAPAFYLTSSPAAYTDPGGTAIASGAQTTIVPATSLSPLGCVDQRYQGVSHFDLVQQTVQGYGYQASVEPQTLESGLFPGVLAPRIREGHDTDVVLKPDRSLRRDGEGLINYSAGLDASDFCGSLQGNGAGLQNGTTGQLQALVYDPTTLNGSLFDAQGWQDFSDAGSPSLLQGLLNSQLGLRLSPWQALQADPQGRARWANTWPLPGSLAKMRWRPGDGLQIQAPEINVVDTSPRQMLVVTRNITPDGQTGTQATFANRPRTPGKTLKQQLYSATRWQRNYQRQIVRLQGTFQDGAVIAAGGANVGPWSMVSLSPGDILQRVQLRIAYITGTAPSIGIETNAAGAGSSQDVTTTVNGPFVIAPVVLDLSGVVVPEAGNRVYVALINKSATNGVTVSYQLLVDVQR